jgi:hypothetical protein
VEAGATDNLPNQLAQSQHLLRKISKGDIIYYYIEEETEQEISHGNLSTSFLSHSN